MEPWTQSVRKRPKPSVDISANVAGETSDSCYPVSYLELVESFPMANKRTVDRLDGQQRMVVGSADTLTTLSNNLHSRLIMIYVEPCCNISLCSAPSSQHWNVQFLKMITAQILNLGNRAISQ